MLAHQSIRSFLLAMTLALSAPLLVADSAGAAGAISRSGTTLTFTSDPGSADRLRVLQTSATTIVFDDTATNLRVAGALGCTVTAGNVGCANVVWSGVIVNLNDGSDTVSGLEPPFPVSIPMRISGGAGNDGMTGGNGPDVILTEANGGSANGAGGNDTMRAEGSDGSAFLSGATGDDVLDLRQHTSPSGAAAVGGDGNDRLFAAPQASGLRGEGGDDILLGGPDDDDMGGGAGNDEVTGGAGNDRLNGDDGIDTVSGGDGDDSIDGGSAAVGNTFVSDGPDTLSGGAGIDRLDYADRTTAVTVDLATTGGDGQAGENDISAADFEGIRGGDASDTLLGDARSNRINGGAGADTIDGRGATDEVFGDADADTITATGDGAADFVVCGNTATLNQPPLANGSDVDIANLDHLDILGLLADCETINREPEPQLPTQSGTTRPDTLTGSNQAEQLRGNAGNDTLRGLAGNDRLRGGPGNDRIFGGRGNDDIDGDAGNDQLFGEQGNDSLDGGTGADLLLGGPGFDTLVGGRGRDIMDGGASRDFLMSRDGQAGDVVTCSRVNLATRLGRAQRDVVVADRRDLIRNRAWCARVTFT